MFALRNKLILILFLSSSIAYGKKYSFDSSMINFGFGAGITKLPSTDLLPSPQEASPSYTMSIAGELGFSILRQIFIQPGIAFYLPPNLTAKGRDSGDKSFEQISKNRLTTYQVKASLVPYQAKNHAQRMYFGGALGKASLKADNTRTIDGFSTIEKSEGSTNFWQMHFGFDFFIRENYSISIEAGYRKMRFLKLTHTTTNDIEGKPKAVGDQVKQPNGFDKTLRLQGKFLEMFIRLHF